MRIDLFDFDAEPEIEKLEEAIEILSEIQSNLTMVRHLGVIEGYTPMEARLHTPDEQRIITHKKVQNFILKNRKNVQKNR